MVHQNTNINCLSHRIVIFAIFSLHSSFSFTTSVRHPSFVLQLELTFPFQSFPSSVSVLQNFHLLSWTAGARQQNSFSCYFSLFHRTVWCPSIVIIISNNFFFSSVFQVFSLMSIIVLSSYFFSSSYSLGYFSLLDIGLSFSFLIGFIIVLFCSSGWFVLHPFERLSLSLLLRHY